MVCGRWSVVEVVVVVDISNICNEYFVATRSHGRDFLPPFHRLVEAKINLHR